jgi:protein phosphatase
MPTPLPLEVGSRTDPGWRRAFNEDRVFADPPSHPSIEETRGLLFAVADGTGIGQTGALAADCAITKVKDEYYYGDQSLDIVDSLRRAVLAANSAVYDLGRSHPSLSGMASTFAALAVHKQRAVVVNVGNSRVYLADPVCIRRIAPDGDPARRPVDDTANTLDDVLLRQALSASAQALGANPTVELDTFEVALQPNETIALCSDGVYGMLGDDEIWSIVSRFGPRRAADELVRLSIERGAKDNLAVVVVGPPRNRLEQPAHPLWHHLPEAAALLLLTVGIAAYAQTRQNVALPTPTPAVVARGNASTPNRLVAASDNLSLGHAPPPPFIYYFPTLTPEVDQTTPTVSAIVAQPGVTLVVTTPTPDAARPTPVPPTAPAPAAASDEPRTRVTTATPRPSRTPTEKAATAVATPTVSPVLQLNPAVTTAGSVQLSWSYSGPLSDDEAFDIRIWGNGSGSPNAGIANVPTSERTYLVGSGFIYGPGTYNWSIALIRTSGVAVQTVVQAASPPLQFTWLPSSSSSGGIPVRPP